MSFRDFPRQRTVIDLLQRSLTRGRLGHAYLLSGNSVTEIEAVARTLAKTVNCIQPTATNADGLPLDSCDHCPSCSRVDHANHPDVLWLRPESKSRIITIEQVRGMMQTIHLKPTEAAYKVGVIVEADRLNSQAANAFLKTLEEPPPRSILLLLSSEPQKMLETILSRCLRLSFSGEKDFHDPAANQWLSDFARTAAEIRPGLLTRYQLLGRLLQKLAEQKTVAEEELTAASPLQQYKDADPKLREKWEDELSAAIEANYRRRRSGLLVVLESWLRDIWIKATGVEGQFALFPDLETNATAIANRISSAEALDNVRLLEQTQRLLTSNVQESLTLEVALLKLKL